MLSRVNGFREPDRSLVEEACLQISRTSLPLYIQAIITFEVLHSIINHVPLYFAQRQSQELAAFTWIVDGKDPKKKTNWEVVVVVRARRTCQYVDTTPYATVGRRRLFVLRPIHREN